MASGQSNGINGAITTINVTPLVDITLVLLIIFMVTAKLIVSHSALQVDLPKAASGDEVQEILSIVLAADGETEVNGRRVTDDDGISGMVRAVRTKHKDLRAVIKADGAVHHSRVMHLLDLLKQAGVTRIGFGVVPELAEPKPASGH